MSVFADMALNNDVGFSSREKERIDDLILVMMKVDSDLSLLKR